MKARSAEMEFVNRSSRALAWAGGAVVFAAACLITIDIVLRLLAIRSIVGVDEISGFALGITSAWAFAYALIAKAHIRIDTVYHLLPRRVRPWLDAAALAALGFFVVMLCYHAITMFSLSFKFSSRSMSPLQIPLWIPQGLWLFGLLFFAAICVYLLVKTVSATLRGGESEVTQIAGPESIEAEVSAEVSDAARRRNSIQSPK